MVGGVWACARAAGVSRTNQAEHSPKRAMSGANLTESMAGPLRWDGTTTTCLASRLI